MTSTARSLRYALAILTTSLVTPSVWAHAHLTHQYPAANAQVTAAPQAITLNFSEGVETGFSGAKITGPKNENIKTLPAKRNEQDQKKLMVPLADSLKPGPQLVDGRGVSGDGQKKKGITTVTRKKR
ncbi:CopC domain-containing protein YobA [Escherichia coli]|nr:CopC domain-containing protein YobA [Escherichia coli]